MSGAPGRAPLRVAIAATIAALGAWTAATGLEVLQAPPNSVLISQPDRALGLDGARFAGLLVAGWATTAALLSLAAVALTLAGRTVRSALLSAALVVVAATALVARVAHPDSAAFADSDARGSAALVLVAAIPLCAVLGAWLLRSAGRTGAAAAGALVANLLAWLAIVAALAGAIGGAHQPQLDAVIALDLAVPALALATLAVALARPHVRRGALAVRAGTLGAVLVLAVPILALGRVAAPPVAAQLTGRTTVVRTTMAGVPRTYRVYEPPDLVARPGLVVVLHGSFGSGFGIEATTGFDRQADRLSWLAVYPDGILDGWDVFGSTPFRGRHGDVDDVAFVARVIDDVTARYAVEPGRVFVAGLSRGGMMAYRLACQLSDRIAAIAAVAGNMADASGNAAAVPCRPARPVSVIHIHGTADRIVPIAGGIAAGTAYAPLADVIARWRTIDGCAGTPATRTDGPSTITTWHCAAGTAITTRIVADMGHTWPGSPDDWAGVVGLAPSFDASALVADFFAAHARTA